jgi:Ca2+-binding RTX toxin-like protein
MDLTNTAPVADDDTFSVQQGLSSTSLSGNLRAGDGVGDHDPDGDTLGWTVAPASLNNAFFSDGKLGFVTIAGAYGVWAPIVTTAMSMTTAAGGTVTIQTNGDFSYQSPAGFSGVDWFDYTLVDAQFATDIGRVTIDVQPTAGANDRPVAANDVFAGAEDQRITGNLLADNGKGADFDPDGDALTVINGTIRTAAGGVVSIFANGDFVYTPRANWGGTDSFTYTVRDGQGASSTATVTLEVASVNDAPIAGRDAFSGARGQPISGNVMANDRDVEGDSLQVVAASITTAGGGAVTLLSDGNFTYSPAANFAGTDGFAYTLLDSSGGSAVGTVTLNVLNNAPRAVSDFVTGTVGNPVSGNVLSNDSDPDGDALSVTAAVARTATGGTFNLAADGSFTYTPLPSFVGTDSFTYTVRDEFGARSTATIVVNYPAPAGARSGTSGDDTLTGGTGNDNISALGGDDIVSGQGGNDLIFGGGGRDTLNGDAGADTLNGDAERDTLNGGADDDFLFGGADADRLNGGTGNDQLFGGAGLDDLTGGTGADLFVLDRATGTSADRVRDFVSGIDDLAVRGSDYGLAAGALPDASYFALSGAAADVGHGRFLYNAATGALAWDADGRAATANVSIATLNAGQVLAVSDFLIL